MTEDNLAEFLDLGELDVSALNGIVDLPDIDLENLLKDLEREEKE